jgi:hypothetical protein
MLSGRHPSAVLCANINASPAKSPLAEFVPITGKKIIIPSIACFNDAEDHFIN